MQFASPTLIEMQRTSPWTQRRQFFFHSRIVSHRIHLCLLTSFKYVVPPNTTWMHVPIYIEQDICALGEREKEGERERVRASTSYRWMVIVVVVVVAEMSFQWNNSIPFIHCEYILCSMVVLQLLFHPHSDTNTYINIYIHTYTHTASLPFQRTLSLSHFYTITLAPI